LRLDWDRVLAAWALVLVLILGGSAALQMTGSIDRAEASSAVHGVKIPRYDPFNLEPPAFEDDLASDPAAAEVDD
jgi:hypothetical protein